MYISQLLITCHLVLCKFNLIRMMKSTMEKIIKSTNNEVVNFLYHNKCIIVIYNVILYVLCDNVGHLVYNIFILYCVM